MNSLPCAEWVQCSVLTAARRISVAAALGWLTLAPTTAHAMDKCAAKMGRDGTIVVSAAGVNGPLLWSSTATEETREFHNSADCVHTESASGCTLAAPEDPARVTPPSDCRIRLLDDSGKGASCSAYVRGCTPGVRTPAFDDLVESVDDLADSIEHADRTDMYLRPEASASVTSSLIMGSQFGGGLMIHPKTYPVTPFEWYRLPLPISRQTIAVNGGTLETAIVAVEICYQVGTYPTTGSPSPNTAILQTRLTKMQLPGQDYVHLDDGALQKSASATCYRIDAGSGFLAEIDGAVALALRLTFGSTNDFIRLGSIKIELAPR